MQRVSVTRLLKDRASHETNLIMEAQESGEELKVRVPEFKAGILALEAHGLNDRCPLYCILLECVAQLEGTFGPVVITMDRVSGNGAAISLTQDGRTRWVSADFVELIALALHLQLPMYVSSAVSLNIGKPSDDRLESEVPQVFHQTFKENIPAERDEDLHSR